jgi:hypothetical protein
MGWTQIASAVVFAAMMIYLFPRAVQVVKNTPKGSKDDWLGYIIPMVAVVLFIIMLIKLV